MGMEPLLGSPCLCRQLGAVSAQNHERGLVERTRVNLWFPQRKPKIDPSQIRHFGFEINESPRLWREWLEHFQINIKQPVLDFSSSVAASSDVH